MTVEGYEELNHLTALGFHVNSAVVIIGLLASLFMFFHALYEWKWKQCRNNDKNLTGNAKKRQTAPKIVYSSLIVLFISVVTFIIYFIEFFWLRMFPPTSYNYNSFTFCDRFTPFLFASIFILTYGIIHYFLIRLECSFKGSIYEYSKYFYLTARILTVLLVICPFILVIIATDGIPYNVEKGEVTNDDPWLCRNGIKSDWSFFWKAMNALGLAAVLCSNFMNWYLFMNRFNKLIELGLSHDDSFIAFYSKKRRKKQKRTRVTSTSTEYTNIQIENIKNAEMTPIEEKQPVEAGNNTNIEQPPDHATRIASNSLSLAFEKVIAKRKNDEEEREEKKKRRQRKELVLYKLIKRQSILTGVVSISAAIFWGFQITVDEGSTMTLCSIITSVICVYLSFNFNIKCFDICCSKCMEDCTCIEDRMERKLAKKMGLKQETILEMDENEENDTKPNDEKDDKNNILR